MKIAKKETMFLSKKTLITVFFLGSLSGCWGQNAPENPSSTTPSPQIGSQTVNFVTLTTQVRKMRRPILAQQKPDYTTGDRELKELQKLFDKFSNDYKATSNKELSDQIKEINGLLKNAKENLDELIAIEPSSNNSTSNIPEDTQEIHNQLKQNIYDNLDEELNYLANLLIIQTDKNLNGQEDRPDTSPSEQEDRPISDLNFGTILLANVLATIFVIAFVMASVIIILMKLEIFKKNRKTQTRSNPSSQMQLSAKQRNDNNQQSIQVTESIELLKNEVNNLNVGIKNFNHHVSTKYDIETLQQGLQQILTEVETLRNIHINLSSNENRHDSNALQIQQLELRSQISQVQKENSSLQSQNQQLREQLNSQSNYANQYVSQQNQELEQENQNLRQELNEKKIINDRQEQNLIEETRKNDRLRKQLETLQAPTSTPKAHQTTEFPKDVEEFVKKYNNNPAVLEGSIVGIARLSGDSFDEIRRNRQKKAILETAGQSDSDSYFVVSLSKQNSDKWLFPKDTRILRKTDFSPLSFLFECRNYKDGLSQFTLIKPAKVLRHGTDQWQVMEKGALEFTR
ncbi:MAG: hypothetical protein AAGA60_26440 [Cyanobacteria bacterium P01_E01_bin.42]